MISVIQLVTHASVEIRGKTVGAIKKGILALIGMEKTDTDEAGRKLIEKILNYRIFPDDNGKTNLNLKDINGELLLVPQFTLVAETQKGLRPGFSRGMAPEAGKVLFASLVKEAKNSFPRIETGEFGADMQVTLCNDGPMTFILQVSQS